MSLELGLIIVLIGGYLSGKLASALKLPSVLGMTIFGVGIAVLQTYDSAFAMPNLLKQIAPSLQSIGLVIILLRAGLGIHIRTLKKVGRTALLLSFVPMIFEVSAIAFMIHLLFGWDLSRALLIGFLLEAISPAVVVPSMLELKEQRRGEKNDVPTLILAGASLDDVFAITFFTMVLGGISHSAGAVTLKSALGIVGSLGLSLILGILPGLVLGVILVWLFRRHHERIRATEKTLLLLGLSIALFTVGQAAHTAALLGVMTVGFILLSYHPPAARELGSKLGKAWIFAEVMLFVLIGMAVDVNVALDAGLRGVLIILTGLAFRSLGVLTALLRSPLSLRERLFVVISYFPKATVQAALGAVPLAAGIAGGQQMLALAVLSVFITTPLGLVAIRHLGPRLLDQDFSPPENSPLS